MKYHTFQHSFIASLHHLFGPYALGANSLFDFVCGWKSLFEIQHSDFHPLLDTILCIIIRYIFRKIQKQLMCLVFLYISWDICQFWTCMEIWLLISFYLRWKLGLGVCTALISCINNCQWQVQVQTRLLWQTYVCACVWKGVCVCFCQLNVFWSFTWQ